MCRCLRLVRQRRNRFNNQLGDGRTPNARGGLDDSGLLETQTGRYGGERCGQNQCPGAYVGELKRRRLSPGKLEAQLVIEPSQASGVFEQVGKCRSLGGQNFGWLPC